MTALKLRARRGLGREDGVASVELMGFLPWLIMAALLAWQMLLAAATVTAAENAARSGSRTQGRGGDGVKVALEALPDWLADEAKAERGPEPGCDDDEKDSGQRIAVCVAVPVIVPGVSIDGIILTRDADLPKTS